MTATRTATKPRGAALPARRRFTLDDYHRMIETGILDENDRVELIDGELIEMAAVGSRHAARVNDLTRWSIQTLGDRVIVSVQNPVRLPPGSEPEPDLMLLRPRPDRYATELPGPGDVFLVVEVSDSTLRYDRGVKLPLYAAASIPEVWIVDLQGQRVLVYREPAPDRYRSFTTVRRTGSLAPAAFPGALLRVRDLFE